MDWQLAKPRDFTEVRAFLEMREWSAVNLADRFRREFIERRKPQRKGRIFVGRENGYVRSCLYGNNFGLLLPACSEEFDFRGLSRKIDPAMFSNLHSIMGSRLCVEKICKVLELAPGVSVPYFTMDNNCTTTEWDMGEDGLVIKQATGRDASALMPLQKMYEMEEVLLKPERYSAATSYILLQRALKSQTVFLAERDGLIVGKAGTNAKGFAYWQAGGVFTVPGERNRGIARTLMAYLMQSCNREGKRMSLFVKKSNTAAITLYKNLGFNNRGDFVISYFGAE